MEAARQPYAPLQRERAIASGASLLLLIGMPIGYISGDTSTGDIIGLIVLTLVSLALMSFLFARFVPRLRATATGDRLARVALTLAVIAAVTVVVFWTGLPFPLGASALALGLAAREQQAGGRGKATVASIIGALAVAVAFVGLLIG